MTPPQPPLRCASAPAGVSGGQYDIETCRCKARRPPSWRLFAVFELQCNFALVCAHFNGLAVCRIKHRSRTIPVESHFDRRAVRTGCPARRLAGRAGPEDLSCSLPRLAEQSRTEVIQRLSEGVCAVCVVVIYRSSVQLLRLISASTYNTSSTGNLLFCPRLMTTIAEHHTRKLT